MNREIALEALLATLFVYYNSFYVYFLSRNVIIITRVCERETARKKELKYKIFARGEMMIFANVIFAKISSIICCRPFLP